MDSPGFCAQYCTYTAMDNASKQIISMVSLDKRETERNSDIMEKEGFVRTLETLQEELTVTEVCTDAHSQIAALFSKCVYYNLFSVGFHTFGNMKLHYMHHLICDYT